MSKNQFSLNVLKYEDIRSNIIDFLKKNSKYGGNFDYSGHNISMIVDAMTYTDMLLAYHLTNIANNIFLDTTTLRKNAVSIAKLLGYRPRRSVPAQIFGNIIYKGKNFKKDSFIIIPPRVKFLGADNNLPYTNLDAIKLTYKDANTLSGRFIFYQGKFKEFRSYGNGLPFQTLTIPNSKISEYNLSVFVKKIQEPDYTKEKWTEVKTFFEIIGDKIYFVEEDIQQEFCPKIIFGSGEIGRIPNIDEEIIIEYFETEGEKGNGENKFILNDDLEGIVYSPDIDFNPDDLYFDIPEDRYSYNGKNPETLEEIQVNAIRFFSAAGRGVTANDYSTIMKQFANIFSFNATGNIDPTKNVLSFNVLGADQIWNNPEKDLGKIYITGIPQINYDEIENNSSFYLEDWQEVAIAGDLQHLGIISTEKTFIKPTYILLKLYPRVEIAPETPKEEISTIFNNVIDNLKTYFKENLAKLGQPFRKSKVQAVIDDTPFVKSSDLKIDFNFIINYNSFYRDKPTIIFLPIIFKRDNAGNIIYDKNYIPLKQSFVKRNTTIIDEVNKLKGYNYDVFTLPPNLSSIYGKLTHPNIVRSMYSKDLKEYKILRFYFINDILINESGNFLDNEGKEQDVSLIESGTTNVWNLEFNSKIVASLIYQNNEFKIIYSPEQEEYLKSLGIILPFIIEKKQKEINGNLFEYYELKINVSNIIADIRITGLRILGCLKYDTVNNKILLENPVKKLFDFTTKQTEGNDVSIKEVNTETYLFINQTPIAKIIHTQQQMSDGTTKDKFNLIPTEFASKLNDFGFKKELEIKDDNCIYAYDIFNESSIGDFNYQTGQLTFKQVVEGNLDDLHSIKQTINEVFNVYQYGDTTGKKNPYDIIHLIPDNIYDENGNVIGQYEDFDTLFSTMIVHNIYSPEVKKV